MPATTLRRVTSNRLRANAVDLQFCAHFLQLRSLFVHSCSQRSNFRLQLSNRVFLLLNLAILLLTFAMFLEELVK